MQTHTGFLLTSHFFDRNDGLTLSFYGTDGERPFRLDFTDQKIIGFVLTGSSLDSVDFTFERKIQTFKNFKYESVDTIYLKRFEDLSKLKEHCANKGISSNELDILPTERFLMERFINGQIEFVGTKLEKDGLDIYQNPQIRQAIGRTSLSLVSLDIETGVGGELYSIAVFYKDHKGSRGQVYMLADEESEGPGLRFCNSEKKMILGFLDFVKQTNPDLIVGWHVAGFDLKFLMDKAQALQIELRLGRDGELLRLNERQGSGVFAEIPGRVVLDGPPILRSAFYRFKDFKLETVATEVLGVGKDIASDSGKVEEIERRFREDKKALAKYNLLDCTLVVDIFEKLQIIDLLVRRVHISGLLIDRLPVSTAAFDHCYLPRLHRKGFVAPNRIDIEREEPSTGGLVIEPVGGLHENVAVFDFKSLYPSIIMTFKIDPFARINSATNTIATPNGMQFSKSENILPGIIGNLMETRALAKREQNSPLSQAVKILMNSFYGVMGSSRCRFYHADLPTAITTTGHWILRKSMEFFENHNLQVIYGDTDSIFVKLVTADQLRPDFGHKLASQLGGFLRKILADEFKVESYLECEFEKTYDKLFFSMTRSGEGAAKKRYAGFSDGQIEFKGMEVIRSDWTDLAKNFQKTLYAKFFAGEELEIFIKDFIDQLENGQFDQDLVYTKKLSKDPREYTKNIPVHVKAALQVDHKGPYRLKEVSYYMTKAGPVPIQKGIKDLDYHHYIHKQIGPIADDVLLYLGKSFDSIVAGEQLSLF